MTMNGAVSFWWRSLGEPTRRPALHRDLDVDVAIVGAGYTGLWTAYALATADPSLRIAVIEKEFVGFGASGRNGGWLTGELSWSRGDDDRDDRIRMQHALWGAVDEVIEVCQREGIEADIVRAGSLRVATTPAQVQRLHLCRADEARHGIGAQDSVWLDAPELAQRIRIAGALAGDWSAHAARVQPARLVAGLARCVEGHGVQVFESTPAVEISPHRVHTPGGTVRADFVLVATEGFTARLPGRRRDVLPMNSAMIVTEPLTDRQWQQIGWSGCELLEDLAHAYLYAQRTADHRIALGGRGVPYRFASRVDDHGRTQQRTIDRLRRRLVDLFPSLHSVHLDHAWCGVLGVPRDWQPTISLDDQTGLGWAGGYVGTGVAASNLAGRTLAGLVLQSGQDGQRGQVRQADRTDVLVTLPWVNRSPRRWEPEPLRWLGVRGTYLLYRGADGLERRSNRPATSRLARVAGRIAGR